ncbi:MAG: alpha/beta fold hydrolase [Chakrabartia sp.]
MGSKAQYTDGYWWSNDGLRLHFRDYSGDKSRPPILCIPGLTRNVRDFEHVAQRLAGDWRVICIDLRGRGESAYAKDPMTYVPPTYVQDIEALLAELKIKRFVSIGTSLGGIITMLMAGLKPGRIAGALLNDIGPVLDDKGLERIRTTVGRTHSWPTWVHAARDLGEMQAIIYPSYKLEDWIAYAKRVCRLTQQGRIVLDYDLQISEPMKRPTEAFDLWPAYEALGTAPVAIVRGALSDLLSEATAREMVRRLPNARLTTVAGVGHAPALNEPAATRALGALLKAVMA